MVRCRGGIIAASLHRSFRETAALILLARRPNGRLAVQLRREGVRRFPGGHFIMHLTIGLLPRLNEFPAQTQSPAQAASHECPSVIRSHATQSHYGSTAFAALCRLVM